MLGQVWPRRVKGVKSVDGGNGVFMVGIKKTHKNKKTASVMSRLFDGVPLINALKVKRIQASCRPRVTTIHSVNDACEGPSPNRSDRRSGHEVDADRFHAASLDADLTRVKNHVLVDGGGNAWPLEVVRHRFIGIILTDA